MKPNKTTALVGMMLAAVATTALAADTKQRAEKVLDQAKGAVTPGEVVLSGSDTKTLHDGKEVTAYQVCVKPEKEAGSVKITNDTSSVTLKPGDCQAVSGMRITATPTTTLTGAMHSTVTFHKH